MSFPGEKVQIDVKEVPYACLRGASRRDGKYLYQWTAIDECTRIRFVYDFEEHTPENTVKFLKMLFKTFPFKIRTIQTDNGTEFTYKFISDAEKIPMDKLLETSGIAHFLIPPKTPWHNGKVERSHRNDQRYFYDWENFRNVDELDEKLKKHLKWSNNKTMQYGSYLFTTQNLRQRIGTTMLTLGIAAVRKYGFKGITVERNYLFYNTLGFHTSSEFNIYPTSGFPIKEPRCMMCQETYPGSLKNIEGFIVYDMYYNA